MRAAQRPPEGGTGVPAVETSPARAPGPAGSLAATHDPSRAESGVIAPVYTSSKAALTMLTTQYAKALTGIRVNAADPGCTATGI